MLLMFSNREDDDFETHETTTTKTDAILTEFACTTAFPLIYGTRVVLGTGVKTERE